MGATGGKSRDSPARDAPQHAHEGPDRRAGPPDELTAPDLLDFAEIAPAQARAIALEQHIAEKVHA